MGFVGRVPGLWGKWGPGQGPAAGGAPAAVGTQRWWEGDWLGTARAGVCLGGCAGAA